MKTNQNAKYPLAVMIALVTMAVYLAALRNGFLNWDDNVYVVSNPYIRSVNLYLFKWAFFHFYAGNWHPLTWISHALDYAVWVLNPLGHHLTNIVIHGINTLLVFLLITRLLEAAKARAIEPGLPIFLNEQTILIAGGVTSLLFGLHPVHVESVAWVAERKDLLCALFYLLSVIFYIKGGQVEDDDRPCTGVFKRFIKSNYLSSLGFFGLALLSKPMAVSLPVVLLLLDWYPLNTIRSVTTLRSSLIEKLPFAALSLISSLLTTLAQKTEGAVVSVEALPLLTRIPVMAHSLLSYLGKMIYPFNLLPFYSYPKNMTLLSLYSLFILSLIAGITIACVVMTKRQKLWLSVWVYFITTLIPVIGIVQVGSQSMADRYTYLPSLGPFLLTSLLVTWVLRKADSRFPSALVVKRAGAVMAVLAVLLVSYLSINQIAIWKDSLSLWNYVIEHEPAKDPLVYLQRGLAFEESGSLADAINDYNTAIALKPSFYQAFNNRGLVYDKMGQLENALMDYNAAISSRPSFYQAYSNRGLVFEKMGQYDNAIKDYNMAISLNPSDYQDYDNAGVLYANSGFVDQAIQSLTFAITNNENYYNAYENRGLLYLSLGQYERSLHDFNKAIALNPSSRDAYLNRAKLYLRIGKKSLASQDFQKACSLGSIEACSIVVGQKAGGP
jgi:Tfp pilus assembly protein PilF